MRVIAFDQEGGITSDMAGTMCEKFNIARELGGAAAHSTAPIAERRLAIIKLAGLKAARACEKQWLLLEKEQIVIESTMATN